MPEVVTFATNITKYTMLAACTTLQDLHQYTIHLSKDLKESPEQPNNTNITQFQNNNPIIFDSIKADL